MDAWSYGRSQTDVNDKPKEQMYPRGDTEPGFIRVSGMLQPRIAPLISQVDPQKVVALFSATKFSSNIIELLQLHDTMQIKWNYA